MKALVLYYSLEGSTESIAKEISSSLDIPIAKIEPVKDIKSKGFLKYFLGGRQVLKGIKPELKPLEVNLDDYDLVFLGSPTWAGTYTPPIKTLLEDHLKGKSIGYFYTHTGGNAKVTDNAKAAIKINNTFLSAIDIMNPKKTPSESAKKAIDWARKLIQQ